MYVQVLVMHGGLFSKDDIKLEDIKAVDRNRQPPEEGIMCELLWSDPQPMPGRSPSKRGVGCQFGPDVTNRLAVCLPFSCLFTFTHFGSDVTNRFLQRNGLKYVVRSHEVKNMGYEVAHNGKCITVSLVKEEFVRKSHMTMFPFVRGKS